MQVAGCRLALPCPAQQWHQCDSECIFVTLEIHLTTLFSEIFCFGDFFYGTGWDGWTDGHTDGIWTDRLFSENIILDFRACPKIFKIKTKVYVLELGFRIQFLDKNFKNGQSVV